MHRQIKLEAFPGARIQMYQGMTPHHPPVHYLHYDSSDDDKLVKWLTDIMEQHQAQASIKIVVEPTVKAVLTSIENSGNLTSHDFALPLVVGTSACKKCGKVYGDDNTTNECQS